MLQKEVFWIIIAAFALIALAIVVSYNYSAFADLKKRTVKLEKKNGHEQHQMDELKKELAEQKEINLKLLLKVQQMETKLSETQKKLEKYERQ